MKSKLLARRPSPAMVVAVVALVSSLTGGAVAATLIRSDDIAKNAVKSKQIAKNAVKSKHIANGKVKNKDLRNNTIKTTKVRNGSLLEEDFAPGEIPGTGPQGLQGEKGDKGDKGDTGATGAAGATNVVVRREAVTVVSGTNVGSADCESGERATGGGFQTGATSAYATQSAPSSDGGSNTSPAGSTPNSWRVQIQATSSTTGQVFVVCASP